MPQLGARVPSQPQPRDAQRGMTTSYVCDVSLEENLRIGTKYPSAKPAATENETYILSCDSDALSYAVTNKLIYRRTFSSSRQLLPRGCCRQWSASRVIVPTWRQLSSAGRNRQFLTCQQRNTNGARHTPESRGEQRGGVAAPQQVLAPPLLEEGAPCS